MTEFKNIESSEKQLPAIIKDDEIDLVALMLHIWNGRVLILKTVAVFVALGLIIALTSPVRYTTIVKLIPESNKSMSLGALGGLAAQFGFGSVSAAAEGGGIPPDYYPEIVKSVPYLKLLMQQPFELPEIGSVTLYDYYQSEIAGSWQGNIKKYTIGLPGVILDWIKGKPEEMMTSGDSSSSIVRLTKEEREVLEWLQNELSLTIDKQIGMITLTTKMPTPELSAEVCAYAAMLLSDYAVSFRTDKGKEDLQFVQDRYFEAEMRFETAQEALARFRDSSHGNLTALAQTRQQRLQSDYDLAFNVYKALAQQLEEARLKLQEETPVVKIIQPAVVPDEKSSPKRIRLMILSVFVGGILGIGLYFVRSILNNILAEFLANKK
ncbi:GNVR domain-containing protein [Alkaliflexus imshenetskii]|uniref:GNVR domain-containing protein n=1 Tax=Alkaliflexus imshenetskii TaxID=286730 RepID=UPI00047AEC80|nr:GNVR domain-containing protein [Alkaliflexus imshenetskii]